MDNNVDSILDKYIVYGEDLNDAEKATLRNALYGLAPSSARYREILGALQPNGGPYESSYRSKDQNDDGTWRNINAGPTFQGPPTLDFLNLDHKQMIDTGTSNARGSDAGGPPNRDLYNLMKSMNGASGETQSPADSPLDEVFRTGSGGFHGPGTSAFPAGSDIRDELVQPGQILDPGSQFAGYEFANMTPSQRIQLHQDPRVMAALYAEAAGGGDGTAAFLMPLIQSADAMSQSGILGGATRDSTIFGGPTSDIGQLGQIEDVMDVMNQPGLQTIDTKETYRRSMERLGNTDFSQYAGDNGQPYTVDDIIGISNSALMASAPFMSRTTQAAISARLQQAGVQYKLSLATGDIDPSMSYPEYLRQIGADTWMGQ